MDKRTLDYLDTVLAYHPFSDAEKMLSAREDFLSGSPSKNNSINRYSVRTEMNWELNELRDEFWNMDENDVISKLDQLKQADLAEVNSSVEHLQKILQLQNHVDQLDQDEKLDPVFVERLKLRLLWPNQAAPQNFELRTGIPVQTAKELRNIHQSVQNFRTQYPDLATLIPIWLEDIKQNTRIPSKVNLFSDRDSETFRNETDPDFSENGDASAESGNSFWEFVIFVVFIVIGIVLRALAG